MGNRIGVIAGSGIFPQILIQGLKEQGRDVYVICVTSKVNSSLKSLVTATKELSTLNLAELLDFLKENNLKEIYLAGRVDPLRLLTSHNLDSLAKMFWPAKPQTTGLAALEAFTAFLKKEGISVLDPTPFLQPFFCPPGLLTRAQPSKEALADLELAFEVARKIADLEIGQAVAVKKGVVIALEALEGTDKMIERAGNLAGEGMVVAKVGRSRPSRLEIPAIGPETIRQLARAKAACLGLEAGQVAFFGQEEALALAEQANLAILAKPRKSNFEG